MDARTRLVQDVARHERLDARRTKQAEKAEHRRDRLELRVKIGLEAERALKIVSDEWWKNHADLFYRILHKLLPIRLPVRYSGVRIGTLPFYRQGDVFLISNGKAYVRWSRKKRRAEPIEKSRKIENRELKEVLKMLREFSGKARSNL